MSLRAAATAAFSEFITGAFGSGAGVGVCVVLLEETFESPQPAMSSAKSASRDIMPKMVAVPHECAAAFFGVLMRSANDNNDSGLLPQRWQFSSRFPDAAERQPKSKRYLHPLPRRYKSNDHVRVDEILCVAAKGIAIIPNAVAQADCRCTAALLSPAVANRGRCRARAIVHLPTINRNAAAKLPRKRDSVRRESIERVL